MKEDNEDQQKVADAELRKRALADPLFILAKTVRLVIADGYDGAWDEIEALKPGFYQPDIEVESYLRANWSELIAATDEPAKRPRRLYQPAADQASKLFLHRIAQGDKVAAACKLARIGRSTVYERRDADPAFSLAWEEAEQVAMQRRY